MPGLVQGSLKAWNNETTVQTLFFPMHLPRLLRDHLGWVTVAERHQTSQQSILNIGHVRTVLSLKAHRGLGELAAAPARLPPCRGIFVVCVWLFFVLLTCQHGRCSSSIRTCFRCLPACLYHADSNRWRPPIPPLQLELVPVQKGWTIASCVTFTLEYISIYKNWYHRTCVPG